MKTMERVNAIWTRGRRGQHPKLLWSKECGIVNWELFALHAEEIHEQLLRLIEKNVREGMGKARI